MDKLSSCLPGKKLFRSLAVTLVVVNVCVVYGFLDYFRTSRWDSNRDSRAAGLLAEPRLPLCVVDPSKLRSRVSPGQRLVEVELDPSILGRVQPGGEYSPPNCTAKPNVAIIVPFREREEHKVIFLRHMHSFLQKQNIRYTIYIMELTLASQFNRALLLNAGFVFASNITNHSCYVFHDVDLLPINEFNFYNCSTVTHMSSNNSKYGYKLPYSTYVGGVVGFTAKAFRQINGFSNLYFGWGQEDDDLQERIRTRAKRLDRRPMAVGIYEALPHEKAPGDQNKIIDRHHLKFSKHSRQVIDGLNSLDVRLVSMELRDLYTRVLIEADEQAIVGVSTKSRIEGVFCMVRYIWVLVVIKLTKFAVALRLRCGSCK